jgi:6-phosphogluconolactonase
MRLFQILALFAVLAASFAAAQPKTESLVYVGTYTGPKSKGIYVYRFDSGTGKLTSIGLAAETASPSFLTFDPAGTHLYAVNEVGNYEGQRSGSLSAFSIDRATGKLTALNRVSSKGAAPCHVSVDKTSKTLLAANYGSGNIVACPIKADGSLGDVTANIQHSGSGPGPGQMGPHAHSVNVSADNRFVVAADLGIDKLLVYKLNPATATLAPNDPPFVQLKPGAGPRHFTFDPSGKFAYSINELQSTVTAFQYDAARGALTELQTISTLPADFSGENSTAEVRVHPNGKFLYGSNRGSDSIAVFAIDPDKGTLTFVERTSTQGKVPRNFAIDPTGRWLIAANQNTDNIVVFRLDPATGKLSPAGQSLEVGAPVCVRFLPLK